MKAKLILLLMCIALTLASCKKEAIDPPVKSGNDPTQPKNNLGTAD